MGWTDERVELLKKLWTDGLSASQIAAELGGINTRRTVMLTYVLMGVLCALSAALLVHRRTLVSRIPD